MSLNLGVPADELSGTNQPPDSIGNSGSGTLNNGTDQPIKRGRGRPKKSADAGNPASINPTDLGGDSGTGDGGGTASGNRKRARTGKEKEAPISVEAFIVALSAAQMSLCALTNIPECDIGQKQTTALAEACANVSRHYPVVMTQKQQDIAVLLYTVGSIGFVQYATYNMRLSREAAEKKRKEEAATVDLSPNRMQ